jgi:two-component system sensor histidine kinase DesK
MSGRLFTKEAFKRSFSRRFDQTDLFWLAYLIFFVIEPIERHSARYWLESVALMAFFLVLYIAFLRACKLWIHIVLVITMVLLGAFTLPFNGGAAAFIIYAAALLPFVVQSPVVIFSALALEVLLTAVECHLLHFKVWSVFLNCFFTLVVGFTNFHFGQKERADQKLRLQQEEIEALAAVAERERIARDLHDVLGHTLSLIVLKSELAGRLLDRELASAREDISSNIGRARGELGELERSARSALADVREAIGGYRARGLSAEVENARHALTAAGVNLLSEGDLQPPNLTAAEETVLALALREAVTNIVRHAEATECRLRLLVQNGHHRLSIQDNGHHSAAHEGNGLRGMRERVESLGGHLSLTREPGTHLLIDLPMRTSAAI